MNTRHSSCTIALPSLDPPGTKHPIPAPIVFNPKPDRHSVRDKFRKIEPLDTLPRGLIPSRRYAWGPPRLLYGWVAPQQTMLDYAKKHKQVKRYGREIALPRTLNRAILGMIRGDGVADISSDLLRVGVTHLGMENDLVPIVIVYTNYDLKRKDLPSGETIQKIQERLGINEPPRWYLDVVRWYWERW